MACNRSGMCCTLFYLPASPEELKRYAEEYIKQPYSFHGIPARIDEMARMVEGRYVGKAKSGTGHYYGPCKNLIYTTDEKGNKIAGCAIHDNKPYTCRGYPNYFKELDPNNKLSPNPSGYKGCGYNLDPNHGDTLEDLKVSSLDLEELKSDLEELNEASSNS